MKLARCDLFEFKLCATFDHADRPVPEPVETNGKLEKGVDLWDNAAFTVRGHGLALLFFIYQYFFHFHFHSVFYFVLLQWVRESKDK